MLGEFVLYERVFLNLVADAGVKDERYIVGRDSLLVGAVEKPATESPMSSTK